LAISFLSYTIPTPPSLLSFFSLPATAPTDISTLSLHDALPISQLAEATVVIAVPVVPEAVMEVALDVDEHAAAGPEREQPDQYPDRKSTRLNSSHLGISYAVFCLKKKKKQQKA